MNPARSAGSLSVGVYDEPELIVSGVGRMLELRGTCRDVRSVGPEHDGAKVDVILCDPVGRSVQIEDYLTAVGTLTGARVLVFTWSTSPSSVRRALAAGASGFLSKGATSADLAAAVLAVHRGETLAPEAARLVGTTTGTAEFSAREAEVLELICRGLSNLEIADQLYVSVNSVKTYVRQIYQKTGITRRAQAVAWGLAHGY